MKLRGISPMESEHVNITPLIDVVMCLIIFFLLVGHFARKAAVKGVKIPVAKNGGAIGDKSGELIINVVPRPGKIPGVQPRPRIVIWGEPLTYPVLAGVLRAYKAKHPNLKIVIRADRSILYKFVAPILSDCAQAGIASIHFMARRPP